MNAQPRKSRLQVWFGKTLGLLLSCTLAIATLIQPAAAANLTAAPPAIHAAERYSAITTPDRALLFLNAQNLVDTWNNIIIQAKTGDEQLKLSKSAGKFLTM